MRKILYIFFSYPTNRANGFTFIELLVVMGLIATLSGGFFAGYSTFTEKQKIIAEGQKLKINLYKAQAKMLSGLKPTGCLGSLSAYQITLNPTNYVTQAVCASAISVETIQLPTGFILTETFSPGNTVSFLPLTRGVNANGSITITNSSTSDAVTVRVNSSGDISGP